MSEHFTRPDNDQLPDDDRQAVINKIEAEARRYAEMYPLSSDGRNTFIIFADWVAALSRSWPRITANEDNMTSRLRMENNNEGFVT